MFCWLLGSPTPQVQFCDGSARLCDARTRSDALLDQARTRALTARLGSW
jgi:hypothetical protein